MIILVLLKNFLINLSKDNISRKLFIPESRIIDGGYPFIKKTILYKKIMIFILFQIVHYSIL